MLKHGITTILLCISILFISGCDLVDTFISDLTGNYDDDKSNTKNIERIEIDYFIDNSTSVITCHNPPPNTPAVETLTGTDFGGDITSIAGPSTYNESQNYYYTEFNSQNLGQEISGYMYVYFIDNDQNVNIELRQVRAYVSSIFGNVIQTFKIKCDGIPYSSSYTDSFTELEVDEYYTSGSYVNNAEASFSEDNDQYFKKNTTITCTNRAYIKVKVHYN